MQAQAGSASPDFAAKEIKISSTPPSIARIILKTYLQGSTIRSISPSSKGILIEDNTKPNANRACNSLPRPRAVLSSPDNDGVIGSRNKLIHERCSTLKVRNSNTGDRISVRPKLNPRDDVIKAERTLKKNLAKSSEKAFKNRKFQEPVVRSQKKTRPGIGKSSLI